MTAQHQCDRCGDPIDGEPIVLLSLRFAIAKRSPRCRLDLCSSCGGSFIAWSRLYGRPCCGTERGAVTRELGEVSCQRCRTIVNECERAMLERSKAVANE